jgi:hypothetical protein
MVTRCAAHAISSPSIRFCLALLLVADLVYETFGSADRVIVEVTNRLDLARPGESITLELKELGSGLPVKNPRAIRVADQRGREILCQGIDLDGDSVAEQLVFQADFAPLETRSFVISSGTQRIPSRDEYKAHGRFVRERYDDFAWENDRIAHRMYGTALETWEREPLTSSGVDIWCKRTRRLVINDWYLVDDYHQDSGEGGDFYSVGRSRGCGGSGIWESGKMWVSRNFTGSRVIANGPLRVMFELAYAAWDVNGRKVSEVKRITLDAGQNLDRFESFYTFGTPGDYSVAAGIKKSEGSTVRLEKASGWMRTWEPVRKGTLGNVGCGIVLNPEDWIGNVEAEGNYLLTIRPRAIYYAGFAWDRSGDFGSVEDWDRYLEESVKKIRSPLVVRIDSR